MTPTPARTALLTALVADLSAHAALTDVAAVYGDTVPPSHDWTKAAVVLPDTTEADGLPFVLGRPPRSVVIEARAYARDGATSARLAAMRAADVIDARLTGPVPSGVTTTLAASGVRATGPGVLTLKREAPRDPDPNDTARGQIVRVRYRLTAT
ncbi:MAG: hypothetical protein ACPG5O_11735 [Pseudoalteromonas tetraodonis]